MAASSTVVQQQLNIVQNDQFSSKASTELKRLFNVLGVSNILNTCTNINPLVAWQSGLLDVIGSFLVQTKGLMTDHSLPKTPLMISYAVDSGNTNMVNIEATARILEYCLNTLGMPVTLCLLSDDKILEEQLKNQTYAIVLCTPAYAKQAEQIPSIKQVLDTFGRTKKNALQTLLCDGGFGDVALKIVDKHYLIRDYKTVLKNGPSRKDDSLAQLQGFIDIFIRLAGLGGLGILPDVLDLKEVKNRQAEVQYKEYLSQLETAQQQLTIDYRLRISLEESTAQHPLKPHLDLKSLPVIKDNNVTGFSPVVEELVSTPAKVSLLLCPTKGDTELSSLALTETLLSQQRRVLSIECGDYPGQTAANCVRLALQKMKLKAPEMAAMRGQPLLILLKGYENIGAYDNLYVQNKLSAWKDVKLIVTCRADFFKSRGYLSCFLADTSNRKVDDVLVHKIPAFASMDAKKASLSMTHVPEVLDAMDIASLSPKHIANQFELTAFLKNLNQIWVREGFLNANMQQNPQIFISYAWEVEKTALVRQQGHLSRISQDLTTLGFSAWLDIERMSGNINAQMVGNIENSQGALVIGTARYMERSVQDTNVKKEFDAMLEKSQQDKDFKVFPLQFSSIDPFPVALQNHPSVCDFTSIDESSDYLKCMTDPGFGLIPRLLGIHDSTISTDVSSKKSLYQKAYATFQDQLQLLIAKHLIVNQGQGDIQAYDIDNRLKDYIEPFGLSTESASLDTRFDLNENFKRFLDNPSHKTAVILGRAGSGKSLFALSTFKSLLQPWHECQNDSTTLPTWLPVYIQLRQYATDPEHCIQNALHRQFHLEAADIEVLKNGLAHQQRILFILDGYDELGSGVRPNLTQSLADWPTAKLLVTVRPEHFDANHRLIDALCLQAAGGQPNFSSIEATYVSPFSPKDIQQYVDNYHKNESDEKSKNKDIYQTLKKLPGMMALLDNPFLLTLVLQSLPQLLKNRESNKNDKLVTRTNIYQAFTETWFLQETKSRDLKTEDCEQFSQELAFRFFKGKTISVSDIQEKKGLWEFFNHQSNQAVQDASPLRFSGGEYSFIHKSLYEYFTACRFWKSVFENDCLTIWQTRFLIEERPIIDFLSELYRASPSPEKESKLIFLIEGSRQQDFPVTASSNAITVLNAARVSFSGRDFHNIRIPGANLTGGILDNTNLEGAQLPHATLQGAWLHGANLKNTVLSDLILGEYPSLLLAQEIKSLCYSRDGSLLAVTEGINTHIYNGKTRIYLKTLKGDTGTVESVAFSSGGGLLATGVGSSIRLWDVATGELQKILKSHTPGVTSLAFSPDGTLLVSGGWSESELWDVATGELQKTLESDTENFNSVAFSPDGSLIASGVGARVKLWNVKTGGFQKTLEGYPDMVESVAFSPNGNLLASSGGSGVKLWNVKTGELQQTLKHHHVLSIAFSPDGNLLASGSGDMSIKLWDVATGELQNTLTGHTDLVNCVAFSPNGNLLASGSKDESVKLWDITTIGLQKRLDSHIVESVAFSPDSSLIASGGGSCVKLWDVATGELQNTLTGHTARILSVAFSPDGSLIASGSDDSVKLWNVATGELQNTLEGHIHPVTSVVFSADGTLLASGSDDSTINLWDVATGELQNTLMGHTDWVKSVAFSPNGSLLASGSDDRSVKLWGITKGGVLRTLIKSHTSRVTSVAFSPDGSVIASGSDDMSVKLWDVATRELQKTLSHTSRVTSVAFSPDGSLLASGSKDNTLTIWLLDGSVGVSSNKSKSCHLTSVSSSINSLAFKQTARRETLLISGHSDRSVKCWKLITVEEKPYLQLQWSRHQSALLSQAANLEGAQGLSAENNTLLKQRGTIGEPLLLGKANVSVDSSANTSNSAEQLKEKLQKSFEEEATTSITTIETTLNSGTLSSKQTTSMPTVAFSVAGQSLATLQGDQSVLFNNNAVTGQSQSAAVSGSNFSNALKMWQNKAIGEKK